MIRPDLRSLLAVPGSWQLLDGRSAYRDGGGQLVRAATAAGKHPCGRRQARACAAPQQLAWPGSSSAAARCAACGRATRPPAPPYTLCIRPRKQGGWERACWGCYGSPAACWLLAGRACPANPGKLCPQKSGDRATAAAQQPRRRRRTPWKVRAYRCNRSCKVCRRRGAARAPGAGCQSEPTTEGGAVPVARVRCQRAAPSLGTGTRPCSTNRSGIGPLPVDLGALAAPGALVPWWRRENVAGVSLARCRSAARAPVLSPLAARPPCVW